MWRRLIAPGVAAVLLAGIVVLAVRHYGTLLGAGPGDPAAWAFPASYAVVAVIGLGWGLVLRIRRPDVYATIGLGGTGRAPVIEVVRAGAGDLELLSRVIAGAFFDLPPSRWLVPDPDARQAMFPAYFGLYLEHALGRGVVHITADRAAAALWLPAGTEPAPPGGYEDQLIAITGPWARRFLAFDATLDRHHPAGTAHEHLAILAVRPDRQGQGLGTALLEFHHRQLDQDRVPAYVEASSQRNRRQYAQHGYVLRGEGPFGLPEGGPVMWPMWRDPRPAGEPSLACPGGDPAGTRAPAPAGVHVIHGWWQVFPLFTAGDRARGRTSLVG